jgi:acetyl-CoA synthetase
MLLKEPIWSPTPKYFEKSRILEFCSFAGIEEGQLDSWASEDLAGFWGSLEKFLGFRWQRSYRSVFDQITEPNRTRWFVEGQFNLTDNCLTRWIEQGAGAKTALVWELEDGSIGTFNYIELEAEVNRVCNLFDQLGVVAGDRIALQMPMIWESVVAQLAAARIGAILVPIFSGYAAEAVVDRLNLSGAKLVIISQSYDRRGSRVNQNAVRVAVCALENVEHVILLGEGPVIEKEVLWGELVPSMPTTFLSPKLPAEHPLLIAYTSGTTGKPKGLTLSQVGFALKAASDAALCFDFGPEDVVTWITDPGWVMSPITIYGAFLNGSTLAVYSGAVDYPNNNRLWDLVDRHGLTFLGVSPTLTRSLMAMDVPAREQLGTLRVMASSGEPWTPDAFEWLFHNAGLGQVPIINYSGGTEVSGGILSNRTIHPIVACGFFGPIPGMGAAILDEEGNPTSGSIGELALKLPSPGMPINFWGEPTRYFETYWARWPGIWWHGDFAEEVGGAWFIRGRSDDTIKVAGKRVGPAEVEAVINSHPLIRESAAIGAPDDIKGEALIIVAKLTAQIDPAQQPLLEQELRQLVASQLGKPLTPKRVILVNDLPKNRSGKILRRVIKSLYLGKDAGDLSSLENPAAVAEIVALR